MNARICTNPNCRAIQPGVKCHLCRTATQDIPPIPLHAIGVEGTAYLAHTDSQGYSIAITTTSVSHAIHIPISDLLHSAQLQLPHLNPAGGLVIMDAIRNACSLIKTKNTHLWAGWVIYLLEVLQDHADPDSFQDVLRNLRQDLDTCFIEADDATDTDNGLPFHPVEGPQSQGNVARKSA